MVTLFDFATVACPFLPFAVTQQFVCNWGQTGLVIDRFDRSKMTQLGLGVLQRSGHHQTQCGFSEFWRWALCGAGESCIVAYV